LASKNFPNGRGSKHLGYFWLFEKSLTGNHSFEDFVKSLLKMIDLFETFRFFKEG
jgi:hypothetical protein